MTWCWCSWTLCILKVNHPNRSSKVTFQDSSWFLLTPGEWQTRFDPLVTSKGVFYLDNKNSVSVDMMKSFQYPFRLLHDPELKSQVKHQLSGGNGAFFHAEVRTWWVRCRIKERWNLLNSFLYRLPVLLSRETPASSSSCPFLAVETCHHCFLSWTSPTSIDVYLKRK